MRKLLADLLAENTDAPRKEMFHLKALIIPAIAAYKTIPWIFTKGTKIAFNEESGFARREIKTSKFQKLPKAEYLTSSPAL